MPAAVCQEGGRGVHGSPGTSFATSLVGGRTSVAAWGKVSVVDVKSRVAAPQRRGSGRRYSNSHWKNKAKFGLSTQCGIGECAHWLREAANRETRYRIPQPKKKVMKDMLLSVQNQRYLKLQQKNIFQTITTI